MYSKNVYRKMYTCIRKEKKEKGKRKKKKKNK